MDRTAVEACVHAFSLTLPQRLGTRSLGDHLGAAVGSSPEFQDYREYVPGDDVRHIDWAAYARSDELFVRLHREEISPQVDLILDTSASMGSDPDKEARCREIALFIAQLCRADRLGLTTWLAGRDLERVGKDCERRLESIHFAGAEGVDSVVAKLRGLKPRSIRIVISDFLFAQDARNIVAACGRGSSAVFFIQLLAAEEIQPEVSPGRRLTDIENGQTLDLVMDRRTIDQYTRRLAAHENQYRTELKRHGGAFVRMNAQDDLFKFLAESLLRVGLVRPRNAGGQG